jgi:hypothetical protein
MTGSADALEFRSPDTTYRPAIEAPQVISRYAAAGNLPYSPPDEHVPAHPGLRGDWEPLVIRTDKRGRPPAVPMPHEAATFRELWERLRCKQIWIVGAAAIAAATDAHGEGGSKMCGAGMAAGGTRATPAGTSQRYDPDAVPSRPGPNRLPEVSIRQECSRFPWLPWSLSVLSIVGLNVVDSALTGRERL